MDGCAGGCVRECMSMWVDICVVGCVGECVGGWM